MSAILANHLIQYCGILTGCTLIFAGVTWMFWGRKGK